MEQNFTEEKINEIQEELMNTVDKENDLLKEIEILSESIAHRLVKFGHTREEFMGNEYIFNVQYNRSEKKVYVMRTDPTKFAIAMGHYTPGIFIAEYDDTFTLEENVYVAVKAALCSKAGMINIEELSE